MSHATGIAGHLAPVVQAKKIKSGGSVSSRVHARERQNLARGGYSPRRRLGARRLITASR